MSTITLGEVLTLLSIVIGLIIQYVALVKSFGERVTRLETQQEIFTKQFRDDINSAFTLIRSCREYKPIVREHMEAHK